MYIISEDIGTDTASFGRQRHRTVGCQFLRKETHEVDVERMVEGGVHWTMHLFFCGQRYIKLLSRLRRKKHVQ